MELKTIIFPFVAAVLLTGGAFGYDDDSLDGLFDDWGAEISRLREERLGHFYGFAPPSAPPENSIYFAAKNENDPAAIADKAREEEILLNEPARFPDIAPLQEATPMHIAAAFNDNPEILETLAEAGADVNRTENDNGATPLHAALYHNRPADIVGKLLELGADINAELTAGKYKGMTPLHVAAGKSDKADVIILLLEKGANTGATFSYGFWDITPAMVLDKKGDETLRENPEVVALISESAEEAQ